MSTATALKPATPAPSTALRSTSSTPGIRLNSEQGLWRQRQDPPAREELVRRYLPLAKKLAARYRHGAEPFDDLIGVARYGLLKAVDRFEPDRGIQFSSYASPTILGEIKRHFRDRTWTVRVPRGTHDLLSEIDKASRQLSVELQRSPSVDEIAERLEVEPVAVLEAFEADSNRRTISLDMPLDNDEENSTMMELVGSEEPGFELAEDRFAIERAVAELDKRDRELLRMRFEEDMTQSEIAAVVGCSQMQISRLLRRALAKLREADGRTE